MRAHRWLRTLSARFAPHRSRRTPARPAFLPRVEGLEDRTTPTAGDLDLTFGTGGTQISTAGFIARSMAVYPATDTAGNADKIVVTGGQYYRASGGSWTTRMAVARFNPNGSPDLSFNKTGVASLNFQKNGYAEAYAVAIQPDGRIVTAGFNASGSSGNFAAARLQANGTLDTTFNKSGMVQTAVGGGRANGIALQPDGRIVLVGSGGNASAAVRYNSNGSLDMTWGGTGIKVLSLGASTSNFTSVAMQNGQIVAAASAVAPGDPVGGFNLVRFTGTGALDSTFGAGGVVMSPAVGTAGDGARALAVQPDGRLVVAGVESTSAPDGSGGVLQSFALARYTANGEPDTTFNGTGRVTVQNAGSQLNDFTSVVYQPADGRIVAAGLASEQGFAVARFNTDGSADAGFGTNGLTLTSFGEVSIGAPAAYGVALQADGRIVLAGGARQKNVPFGWSFGLARFLGDDPPGGSGESFSVAPPVDPDRDKDPWDLLGIGVD